MGKFVKVNKLDEKTLEYINKTYGNALGEDIIIEISNTYGVTSELFKKLNPNIKIRIVGGYTEKNLKNRWYKQNFIDATTYTRNEAIKIVQKMEEFEKDILPNWSQIQKTAYIYNKLKGYILYDPEYETKDRNNPAKADYEMRSLRSLISRKCVCAGYALTLKEMLDRQGIESELAIGGTKGNPGNHAWLIVTINGRKFPLDLTWDATQYRRGNMSNSNSNFFNVDKFIRSHIPDSTSETLDYERNLSGLSKKFVDMLVLPLGRNEQYTTTTYFIDRSDGSRAIIAQMGEEVIYGRKIYKYAFINKGNHGGFGYPVMLCSTTNVAELVNNKNFNPNLVDSKYEYAIDNQLFSTSNISDSLRRGSSFIGGVVNVGNNYQKIYNVEKNNCLLNEMRLQSKMYRRSNHTAFVLQKNKRPHFVDGKVINEYDYCEFIIDSDNKYNFKKYKLFSEQDFLQEGRQGFADEFLKGDRLERLAKENGGYVGVYTPQGRCSYDENIKKFFKVKRTNWTKDDVERYPRNEMKPIQTFKRTDGSTFTLKRIKSNPREVGGNHVWQYEYKENVKKKGGGTIKRKKQIFTSSDLFDVLRDQEVLNRCFSVENLSDENLLKTGRYIGKYDSNLKKFVFSQNTDKIFRENRGLDFSSPDFQTRIKRILNKDVKTLKRSDGTSIKLRRVAGNHKIEIHGREIFQYEYQEEIKTAPWIREKRKEMIFSEENLFEEKRQEVIDYLLGEKRIQKRCAESGGYLGFYDKKGVRHVNPKRSRFFRAYPRNFESLVGNYSYNINKEKECEVFAQDFGKDCMKKESPKEYFDFCER